MDYRFLGKSGLKLSALSFGAWVTFGEQVDEEVAYQSMKLAYDSGINFFDNAEIYAKGKAETVMGKIIKKADWKRSDLVLSTKIFWGGSGPNDVGLSRKHIIEGADAAIKAATVKIIEIRLAMALGGKAFCTVTGEVAAVTSAVESGARIIADKGLLVNKVVIPQPRPELLSEMV